MTDRRTVFMFSGQGSHYFQMGRELFDSNDVFRQWMTRLHQLTLRKSGEDVLGAIYSGNKSDVFNHTSHTHPAIFMVEYSLAQCLLEAGIIPDIALGASLGSFAAAAIAGFLTVEDALDAVIRQAKALEEACGSGGMIAVLAAPTLYREDFLRDHSELAAINFDSHFVVSAPAANLAMIEQELNQRGITNQRLAVSFAFHSRWIDAAGAQFSSTLARIDRSRGRLPLACCRAAAILAEIPQDFLWSSVRQPIRFQETIGVLEQPGACRYIDVGPSGTLATFAKYCLPPGSRSSTHAILTQFGRDQRNLTSLLSMSASQ